MRLRRKRGVEDGATVRLFYASDIHGSDLLWRKFLGAAAFYGAAFIASLFYRLDRSELLRIPETHAAS